MVTGEQIKAARALLRWTAKDLSDRSGVSVPTIQRIEATRGEPSAMYETINRVRLAFEASGVEFAVMKRGGFWRLVVSIDVGPERPTADGGATLGDTSGAS